MENETLRPEELDEQKKEYTTPEVEHYGALDRVTGFDIGGSE